MAALERCCTIFWNLCRCETQTVVVRLSDRQDTQTQLMLHANASKVADQQLDYTRLQEQEQME